MKATPAPDSIVPDTRERILRAAMELFRRHGFHNTSLSRILKDAGITKGGFYFHFKSKEELGFAVLENTRNFWMVNVIAAIEDEPDTKSRVRKMVEVMTQKMEDIPERERWLWKNKDAMAAIERGFKQAEAGELTEIPSKYLEFDEDEGV